MNEVLKCLIAAHEALENADSELTSNYELIGEKLTDVRKRLHNLQKMVIDEMDPEIPE